MMTAESVLMVAPARLARGFPRERLPESASKAPGPLSELAPVSRPVVT